MTEGGAGLLPEFVPAYCDLKTSVLKSRHRDGEVRKKRRKAPKMEHKRSIRNIRVSE